MQRPVSKPVIGYEPRHHYRHSQRQRTELHPLRTIPGPSPHRSEADLDKDGQVSLLEAFLTASHQAAEFYKLQGRLVTEHALLDDNGDGLGTPADWFRGLRAIKRPKDNAALDGPLAHRFCLVPSPSERKLTPEQRSRRDALERAVLLHREKKGQLPDQDYYRQLEDPPTAAGQALPGKRMRGQVTRGDGQVSAVAFYVLFCSRPMHCVKVRSAYPGLVQRLGDAFLALPPG